MRNYRLNLVNEDNSNVSDKTMTMLLTVKTVSTLQCSE